MGKKNAAKEAKKLRREKVKGQKKVAKNGERSANAFWWKRGSFEMKQIASVCCKSTITFVQGF